MPESNPKEKVEEGDGLYPGPVHNTPAADAAAGGGSGSSGGGAKSLLIDKLAYQCLVDLFEKYAKPFCTGRAGRIKPGALYMDKRPLLYRLAIFLGKLPRDVVGSWRPRPTSMCLLECVGAIYAMQQLQAIYKKKDSTVQFAIPEEALTVESVFKDRLAEAQPLLDYFVKIPALPDNLAESRLAEFTCFRQQVAVNTFWAQMPRCVQDPDRPMYAKVLRPEGAGLDFQVDNFHFREAVNALRKLYQQHRPALYAWAAPDPFVQHFCETAIWCLVHDYDVVEYTRHPDASKIKRQLVEAMQTGVEGTKNPFRAVYQQACSAVTPSKGRFGYGVIQELLETVFAIYDRGNFVNPACSNHYPSMWPLREWSFDIELYCEETSELAERLEFENKHLIIESPEHLDLLIAELKMPADNYLQLTARPLKGDRATLAKKLREAIWTRLQICLRYYASDACWKGKERVLALKGLDYEGWDISAADTYGTAYYSGMLQLVAMFRSSFVQVETLAGVIKLFRPESRLQKMVSIWCKVGDAQFEQDNAYWRRINVKQMLKK